MKLEDVSPGYFDRIVWVGQSIKIEQAYISGAPFHTLDEMVEVIRQLELTFQNGICVYFTRTPGPQDIISPHHYLYRNGEVEEILYQKHALACEIYNKGSYGKCETNPIPLEQIPLSELDVRMQEIGFENRFIGIMRSTLRKVEIAESRRK